MSSITLYVSFRTRNTINSATSKTCVAIYNSFANVELIPSSVFKLTCLLNVLTSLSACTVTSSAFRFLGVPVSNFRPYKIMCEGKLYANQSWEASLELLSENPLPDYGVGD